MTLREDARTGIALYEGRTSSGLPVYVFPMPGFQTRYAMLAVRYGGCDRRFRLNGRWLDTPAGIAHYLEHKLFDMPGYDAMERFNALGASANAFTAPDMTGYLFACTEKFQACLQELLQFVTTPCFTPESVEKERGIITQEIRMGLDDPGRRVHMELMRALYRQHPVREPIAGTVETIGQITADTLHLCHSAFYTPENMVLCCAGDLEPEQVLELAEALVPAGGAAPERDYGPEAGLLPVRIRSSVEMPVSMPLFRIGSKLEQPAGWSQNRLQLTAELAAELLLGESSQLYQQMYEEGLINTSFSSGVLNVPGSSVLCIGGRCAQPVAVLGRIADAAERFRVDEAAARRLANLKRAKLGNFMMSLDSAEDLCHTQAEYAFSSELLSDYPGLCSAVTDEEVGTLVREMLKPERLALSQIEPLSQS